MPVFPQSPHIRAPDLLQGLQDGELTLVYQPKIALASNEIVGVEALARWLHPDQGTILPSAFIPVAEADDVIEPFTEWVIATAASDWKTWHQQGTATNIAVNVSAINLARLDFPDMVAGICNASGMPCEHLTIELTESATQGVVELLDTLTRCRIKGMKISLDDFGTGYSSLIQLQRLPFSDLKIDKSFVIAALTSRDAGIIVRAIVDLAHNLGLLATAEGVETESVRTMLTDIGCDAAQGYLFAHPMPADELHGWISRHGASRPKLAP